MTVFEDPELGPVRLCGACGELWPFDAEFWHIRDGRLHSAWLPRCIACCQEYAAGRRRVSQRIARRNRRTMTPKDGRCGARMRTRLRCGRQAGHPWSHRSVEAMHEDVSRKRRAA